MDATDSLRDLNPRSQNGDEESGSAYETSSGNRRSSSLDKDIVTLSRAASRQRGRLKSRRGHDHKSLSASDSDRENILGVSEDAKRWASNFQAPQSLHEIRSPSRRPPGSRGKRKPEKSWSELKSKRLRSYYSNEYRELLNVEIHDAKAKTIPEDQTLQLYGSQIGSTPWNSGEKHSFFSALSRLRRDNVREIARFIGSKSELEVQEYCLLLEQGTRERNLEERRQQTVAFVDHPAALEITEECCAVLERAGHSIAARQECYEEQKEEAKWGDIWLLTRDIAKSVEKSRKTEEGEKEIEESLPAANLLYLKNWLELSHRVFMNPSTPAEDDNWHSLVEPGEMPAIRATAFEDFYSLTVSITKRLVSTTLYCTESRLRSTKAKLVKHAEVHQDDVEAAVKILGMKSNSSDFWRDCPRRCNLEVLDGDNSLRPYGEDEAMTLDEVEFALGKEPETFSRLLSESERGYSRSPPASDMGDIGDRLDTEDLTNSESEFDDPYSSDYSLQSEVSEIYSSDEGLSGVEFPRSGKRRQDSRQKRIEDKKALNRAQEEYTLAFDAEANALEEQRLWALLQQEAPFKIKDEPLDLPDRPKAPQDGRDPAWRDNFEYWSQWETLLRPPPESFLRNRTTRSRSVKVPAYGRRSSSKPASIASALSIEIENRGMEEQAESIDGEDADLYDIGDKHRLKEEHLLIGGEGIPDMESDVSDFEPIDNGYGRSHLK